MTITLNVLRELLRTRFVEAGIDPEDVQREIDLIFEHTTGWPVAKQHLEADTALSNAVVDSIDEIAERRTKRVPLQYCLGEAWFMGLRFHVRPGVLIPRPDTEALVETTLRLLSEIDSPVVVDVGTGSGAIAIAMAKTNPKLRVFAVDVSEDALRVARENAKLNGVSDRVDFILTDWLEYEPDVRFNAVVANPPYIPFGASITLDPEVREHEPHGALFGIDDDGLGFYRHLSKTAQKHLLPGGFIAVEVGHRQADAVREMFVEQQWQDLQVHYDLNKIARVVSAFAG